VRLQIYNSPLQYNRDGMSPAVRAKFGENILDVMLDSSSVRSKSVAISLLAFPPAIKRTTSISRGVKVSSVACSAIPDATSEDTRFWPACTARIVSSSSFRNMSLSK
jgi:hypothetical protein